METISALWFLVMTVNLIMAIRLAYAIEARSGQKGGPRYASLIPVALNIGVARDEETQRMRRRMNIHLLFIPVGLALYIGVAGIVK